MKKRNSSRQLERLGIILVEQAVLQMGLIWREQPVEDSGVDGHIEMVNQTGNLNIPSKRLIAVQIKAADPIFGSRTRTG